MKIKGKVVWFNVNKGYGFIAGENGKEYFVHYSQIDMGGFKSLTENQQVEFEVSEDDSGRLMAKDVKKIDDS